MLSSLFFLQGRGDRWTTPLRFGILLSLVRRRMPRPQLALQGLKIQTSRRRNVRCTESMEQFCLGCFSGAQLDGEGGCLFFRQARSFLF